MSARRNICPQVGRNSALLFFLWVEQDIITFEFVQVGRHLIRIVKEYTDGDGVPHNRLGSIGAFGWFVFVLILSLDKKYNFLLKECNKTV